MTALVSALAARRVTPARSWRGELVRDVLPVVLATRLLFVLLTGLVPLWRALVGTPPLILRPTASTPATGTPFDTWNRWDTRWYGDLAHLGYNLRGPDGYKNVAFFPLYPLLTRTLHDILAFVGRNVLGVYAANTSDPPYLVPAMLVSNLCTVAALAFFYYLVRLDYGRPVARRAVTLLALSPMSLFLFAAYSEGTFLLCAIAFFYTLRLERWWQAGLWGLLAAATRPPGAVLLVPFLLAWAASHPIVGRSLAARLRLARRVLVARLRARLQPPRSAPFRAAVPLDLYRQTQDGRTPRRRAGDVGAGTGAVHAYKPRQERGRQRAWWVVRRPRYWPAEVRRAVANGAPVAAIPLGLGLFMVALYLLFPKVHDPFLFGRVQQAWWRTFAPPWETLYISVVWPLGDLWRHTLTPVDLSALHDLCYELAGLALTWLAWRRLARVQGVYLWLLWGTILSSPAMLTERRTGEPHHDVLMSLPRMLLIMFPLCTYLGLRQRLYPWLVGLFGAALTVYSALFLTGGWVS